MTEEEARAWVSSRFGPAATDRMATFVELVVEENSKQNLISPATVPQIWTRHIVDSLQLLGVARSGAWLDIGTGGGFPGLAIAIVRNQPMTLVEPRRKRADFLRYCVDVLGLAQVTVQASKVEAVRVKAAVISARAVASVEQLLRLAAHCAETGTQWLLPRGVIDQTELGEIAERCDMMFHVEHSITQAGSSIVVMSTR